MAQPLNEVDALVEMSKVPDQYKQIEELQSGIHSAAMEFDVDYTYFDDDDDDYFDNYDDDDVYDENEQTSDEANYLAAQLDADRLPPGAEVSVPWLQITSTSAPDANLCGLVASEPAILKPESDVEKKYRLFKQFDVVSDHSSHRFSAQGSKSGILGRKESVEWSRKIQNEWKLLEKDLPGSGLEGHLDHRCHHH